MASWRGKPPPNPKLKLCSVLTACSASVDGTAYNAGGKLSVGGLSITIPKNLQVQFPAAWVPWKDFVSGGYNGNELSVNLNANGCYIPKLTRS
jgi:hypothetical protein